MPSKGGHAFRFRGSRWDPAAAGRPALAIEDPEARRHPYTALVHVADVGHRHKVRRDVRGVSQLRSRSPKWRGTELNISQFVCTKNILGIVDVSYP